MNTTIKKFLQVAFRRKPGSNFDRDIQKLRQLAIGMGLSINPVGAGDRKTQLPGSWRNVGVKDGSCPRGCQFLPIQEGGNGTCYVLKGDKTAMCNKRATTDLERSLLSDAIAILAAVDKNTVARLHVAGDFFKGGKIDWRYINGLIDIATYIRKRTRQDIVAYTYCHDKEVEHFAPYKVQLRKAGVRVRNSDHNIEDGAIVWPHDKLEALRIAFPERKLIPCLYQVNKTKTCDRCQLCWDERYLKCTIVFHPDNSAALQAIEESQGLHQIKSRKRVA